MEVLYTNFQLPNRKWTVDASPHRDPAVDVPTFAKPRHDLGTWPWQNMAICRPEVDISIIDRGVHQRIPGLETSTQADV